MSDEASASPQPGGEGALHNPVLTRSREPARHSWLMIIPLVVVVVAGAAFWAYVSAHPAGPIVNHAVAAASDKPAWQ